MSDKVFRVYGDNDEPISIYDEHIVPDLANYYDDILKFSHAKNVRVGRCSVAGGFEDAIDMNRGCYNITIDDCDLASGGKYVMTIKDSQRVILTDCVIITHGKETDIDIGNWTDTSKARTKDVRLIGVTSSDGKPVRVRVGNADWPQIVGGNCKIDYLGSYLLKAYWYLKSWGIIR